MFELHITPLLEFVTSRQASCGNCMRIEYILIISTIMLNSVHRSLCHMLC